MPAVTWAVFPGGWRVGPAVCGDIKKVWIGAPSGESGDFCRDEFEAVLTAGEVAGDMSAAIERFFWENF